MRTNAVPCVWIDSKTRSGSYTRVCSENNYAVCRDTHVRARARAHTHTQSERPAFPRGDATISCQFGIVGGLKGHHCAFQGPHLRSFVYYSTLLLRSSLGPLCNLSAQTSLSTNSCFEPLALRPFSCRQEPLCRQQNTVVRVVAFDMRPVQLYQAQALKLKESQSFVLFAVLQRHTILVIAVEAQFC